MYEWIGIAVPLGQLGHHTRLARLLAGMVCLAFGTLWTVIPSTGAMAQAAADPVIVEHSGPRPNNAIVTSNGWRCRDGYALGPSGRCEAVRAPANALVTGNSWRCMTGFVRREGKCARLVAPAYGFIQGDKIKCTAGFRLTDDAICVPVVPPRNAIVAGNDWRCLPGYSRNGDQCDFIQAPANGFVRGNRWVCRDGYRVTETGAHASRPRRTPSSVVMSGSAAPAFIRTAIDVAGSTPLRTRGSTAINGSAMPAFCARGTDAPKFRCRPTPPSVAIAGVAMAGSSPMAGVAAAGSSRR